MGRFRPAALALALSMTTTLAACGAGVNYLRPGPQVGSRSSVNGAVEVNNRENFPVVINYFSPRGGPFRLAILDAGDRRTINLPELDVEYIYAETQDGRRLDDRDNRVRIRRIPPVSAPAPPR